MLHMANVILDLTYMAKDIKHHELCIYIIIYYHSIISRNVEYHLQYTASKYHCDCTNVFYKLVIQVKNVV